MSNKCTRQALLAEALKLALVIEGVGLVRWERKGP